MDSTTLINTYNMCSSVESIKRAFSSQILRWTDTDYLVVNMGNELGIWSLHVPGDPSPVDESFFNVGNVGDSDYDLLNFSICDDCRWGVANFKGGTVLFDLGAGADPVFPGHTFFSDAYLVPGAFTFTRGESQYLVASNLPDECPSGDSALFKITGTTEDDLERVGCIEADGVAITKIVAGIAVGDYLYLGDLTSRVFIFAITDLPESIELAYVSTPMYTNMIGDKGLAVDPDNGIAIQASLNGMTVWNISDPGYPTVISTVPGDFRCAAVHCQYAFVARTGSQHSERTFDIREPTNPVELSQTFWDPSHNWNLPTSACAAIRGAVFYPPTSTLYLSRYGVLQIAEFNGCGECLDPDGIFSDGFESGSWVRWSGAVGIP